MIRPIFERWWLVCSNFLTECARRHMTRSSNQLLLNDLLYAENWHARCLPKVASLSDRNEKRSPLFGGG
jgi:hypothetical protein